MKLRVSWRKNCERPRWEARQAERRGMSGVDSLRADALIARRKAAEASKRGSFTSEEHARYLRRRSRWLLRLARRREMKAGAR